MAWAPCSSVPFDKALRMSPLRRSTAAGQGAVTAGRSYDVLGRAVRGEGGGPAGDDPPVGGALADAAGKVRGEGGAGGVDRPYRHGGDGGVGRTGGGRQFPRPVLPTPPAPVRVAWPPTFAPMAPGCRSANVVMGLT